MNGRNWGGLLGLLVLLGCGPNPPPPVVPADSATPPHAGVNEPVPAESNEPWFEEVARARGLDFVHHSGHRERFLMPEVNTGGIGLLDFDRDGWLDIFCVDGGSANPGVLVAPQHRLYRNLGDGHFEDFTARAGFGAISGYGMGVACADYDGDGWTDLYLLNLGHNVLWRNRGNGTFEEVTARAGVGGSGWSSSAAFFDYDRDGLLDLFVVEYLHWSWATEIECYSRGGALDYCSPLSYRAPARDRLYHNRGDGTFVEVGEAVGLGAAFGNGLGVTTGDFDHDGWVDVFVANDAMPNQLWMNRLGTQFTDEALRRGAALNAVGIPRAGMGVVAVDLRQRGWFDLFVTHLAGEGNGLFVNEQGLFTDQISPRGPMLGSRSRTGFGVAFRDFDHDGELDLFVANGRVRLGATDLDARDPYAEPNLLLRGTGDGQFSEVTPVGGTLPILMAASRGAAFGDLDNDGAEDVVIANKDGPVHLLHNRVGNRGRWLGITALLKNGVVAHNAILRLRAGGREQWRQVQPNDGYASSHDPRVVFGLGTVASLETVTVTVTVRWPDGRAETFAPGAVSRYVTLIQGQGQPAPGAFTW